ncbi:MAG: hypothetical protein A2Y40_03375 [Candidatus Margulisbacteria bacterium GWF2_35_9]|nr:MAG: hypothetical protein A2Y40_03375 [Candidatus Margulisbacteria bacterium GWF2_35_9]
MSTVTTNKVNLTPMLTLLLLSPEKKPTINQLTLGKKGECASVNTAVGCLETDPSTGNVVEGEFKSGSNGINYDGIINPPFISVMDNPDSKTDVYKECTAPSSCSQLSLEDALGADSKIVQDLFSKEYLNKANNSGDLKDLSTLRRLLAEEVSSKNAIGILINPTSMSFPGVLHSFGRVSSTLSTDETVSFLVGYEPLKQDESLPTNVANDNMIKVAIANTGTLYPALVYLDLESNQNLTLYRTSFYKGTPSWKSITLGDYEYLDYLMKMKESLEKGYSGDASTNGKIQAYEAIKYINSIIGNYYPPITPPN